MIDIAAFFGDLREIKLRGSEVILRLGDTRRNAVLMEADAEAFLVSDTIFLLIA